jgi:hypothetical protein
MQNEMKRYSQFFIVFFKLKVVIIFFKAIFFNHKKLKIFKIFKKENKP